MINLQWRKEVWKWMNSHQNILLVIGILGVVIPLLSLFVDVNANNIARDGLREDVINDNKILYNINIITPSAKIYFLSGLDLNVDLKIDNLSGSKSIITNTGISTHSVDCYLVMINPILKLEERKLITTEIPIGSSVEISEVMPYSLLGTSGDIQLSVLCDYNGENIAKGNLESIEYEMASLKDMKIYGIDMTCKNDAIDLGNIESKLEGALYGRIETKQGLESQDKEKIYIRYKDGEGGKNMAEAFKETFKKTYTYLSQNYEIEITNDLGKLYFLNADYATCNPNSCNTSNFEEILKVYNPQLKQKALWSRAIYDNIINDGVDIVFYIPKTENCYLDEGLQ